MLQFDLHKAIAMIEERWGRLGRWTVGVVLIVAVLAFISFAINTALNQSDGIYSTVARWFVATSQPIKEPLAPASPKQPTAEEIQRLMACARSASGRGIGIMNMGTNTTMDHVQVQGFERGVQNCGDGLSVKNSDIKR